MSNFLHYNKFQQSIQISINNHSNFKFFLCILPFLARIPFVHFWSTKKTVPSLILFSLIPYSKNMSLQNCIQRMNITCSYHLSGYALDLLVTVSSMCYHTSTSALSTSYSSRVFTPLKGWDISSWGGLHA